MAAPNQQQQAPPNQVYMIRPGQIDALPNLAESIKNQYKQGLAALWHIVENHAPDSKERQEAEGKIRVASQKLMTQLRGRPASAAGQQRPNQVQQQQQQQQQGAGQQQQQGPSQQQTLATNCLTAEQQRMLQQQQQLQQQQMQHPAQARAAVQLKPAGQPGQQPNPQQQQQQMQQMQQQQAVQLKIKGELDSTNVVHPPGMPDHTYQTLKEAWRKAGAGLLQNRETIMNRARPLIGQVQMLQKSNQTIPDTMQTQYAQAKGAVDAATSKWNKWKQVVESGEIATVQTHINNTAASQQRPGTQQGQQGSNGPPQQPQLQQQSQNDAKPVNAASSPSPPQIQGNFQQTPQGNQNHQNAPSQQNMAQQQPTQPQLQQQQQTSQSLAQSQMQGGQNFPPNMQQPPNQIARPQINTNAQHMQTPTQAGQQQQGTPASAVPNSAGQPAPQRPQALTHNQAVSQAADAARQQNQAQGQQMQPQMPNGLPFNTQPSPATQQNTPTGGYPNLQPQQGNSSNTKFPIPKTLALDPRSQQAVAGPPSRPTMATPGMMYQPGIQRPPPYTLEGEGDRVLSKRKLDELVRQVTGAAPSSINESESSSVLAPEVEESMLQVADNFVDDVITSACRTAKLRSNQTLDIRDIQMVLERNYGIRIPGYSLDETRIVRKFQPAPGWHSKMQAVQAGKVMNNRDQ